MAFWDRLTSRGNVEDRRGLGPTATFGGGIGVTGLVLLLVFNYLSGGDVTDVLSQVSQSGMIQQQEDTSQFAGEDEYEVFASTVLGSANDTWSTIFTQNNRFYTAPKLVLFRGVTDSACGGASADVGPHYCPVDTTIYLDETFFDELTNRFGARGGDVAEAYVIAHEVAHHAQNELGAMENVMRQRSENPESANELSIKMELQADCYAGLWANSIRDRQVFEPGEIKEAMDAAAAVGDDRIQRSVTGYINPETWTHGSSEERVRWFNKGYEQGTLAVCDTF